MRRFPHKQRKINREPVVPLERRETVRREIISLLEGNTLSAKELSIDAGITERDAYEHLEHIQKTLGKSGRNFIIIPAACRRCAFVFRKREKLKKPGRCPVCHSEAIQEPLFSIKK